MRAKELPRKGTEQHGKIQFINMLPQCNSVKIRGEKIQKEGEKMGRWEGGIVEHGAKSMAQSGQKGASKRITTEGHGAARIDNIYKYVSSV